MERKIFYYTAKVAFLNIRQLQAKALNTDINFYWTSFFITCDSDTHKFSPDSKCLDVDVTRELYLAVDIEYSET